MIKARLAIKSPTRPTNIEIGMHKVSIKNMHVYIYIYFCMGYIILATSSYTPRTDCYATTAGALLRAADHLRVDDVVYVRHTSWKSSVATITTH